MVAGQAGGNVFLAGVHSKPLNFCFFFFQEKRKDKRKRLTEVADSRLNLIPASFQLRKMNLT
jgi:hypothetical protein